MDVIPNYAPFKGLPDHPAILELRSRAQWVAWKYQARETGVTKPPINVHNGYLASHSDPSTWATYEQAAAYAIKHGLPGVGYVLTEDDDITGADLDKCRDPATGQIEAWAALVVSLKETYTEVSPSGRGLRLLWRGKVEKTLKCDPAHVEVYRSKRFLTITGNHLAGTPLEVLEAPKTLEGLRTRVEEYKPAREPAPPPPRPGNIITAALAQMRSSFGTDFFRNVNNRALENLERWVPSLFGDLAEYQPGTGAWRVSSKKLGRQLQEDLSIAPHGIVDFGTEETFTPVNLVLQYGEPRYAKDAAFWLCERLGLHPAQLGWSERPGERAEETKKDDKPPEPIKLRSAFPIDRTALPLRDWVCLGLLLRKHLSVLVAPPGSGKSLLTLQIAIAAALGLSWAGWTFTRAVKVLVINAEDDLEEMQRRLTAAAEQMGVDEHELEGKLFLADNPESIVIARTDSKTKTVTRTPLLEQLVTTVEENGIELVISDPFAETFEGDENSNSEVKWAGIAWREVGRRTNSAVWLVHHTRKYAQGMAGDADASRGGGALIGTARIVSTLFNMTEEEALSNGIENEERDRYVRFDDAKANLNLVTRKARWFEKVTIKLDNGPYGTEGDHVGVLKPYTPKDTFDGVDTKQIANLLEAIDRGLIGDDGKPTGVRYTTSAQGGDRYVGILVTQTLNIPIARARKMIASWIESGALVLEDYKNPVRRHTEKGLRFDRSKRPGDKTEG